MSRTPIFLFSLPRSGSTLLQRILSAHNDISSAAEPWILLPIFQALHQNSTVAQQDHHTQNDAIAEFIAHLSDGQASFDKATRSFATSLYDSVEPADDSRYFLDKTPRYTLVCDDILRAFPDAKFIALVRHLLSIAASVFSTWNK